MAALSLRGKGGPVKRLQELKGLVDGANLLTTLDDLT